MQKKISAIGLLMLAATLATGIAQAQTVAIAPTGYITAGPGGTFSFQPQ